MNILGGVRAAAAPSYSCVYCSACTYPSVKMRAAEMRNFFAAF